MNAQKWELGDYLHAGNVMGLIAGALVALPFFTAYADAQGWKEIPLFYFCWHIVLVFPAVIVAWNGRNRAGCNLEAQK